MTKRFLKLLNIFYEQFSSGGPHRIVADDDNCDTSCIDVKEVAIKEASARRYAAPCCENCQDFAPEKDLIDCTTMSDATEVFELIVRCEKEFDCSKLMNCLCLS